MSNHLGTIEKLSKTAEKEVHLILACPECRFIFPEIMRAILTGSDFQTMKDFLEAFRAEVAYSFSLACFNGLRHACTDTRKPKKASKGKGKRK